MESEHIMDMNTSIAQLTVLVEDAEVVIQEASLFMARGITDEVLLGQTARQVRDALGASMAGSAKMMPALRKFMTANINKGV